MSNLSIRIALLSLKQRQLMIRADAASDQHKWITTETGSHIKIDGDGNIVAGAGGKFNGKPLSSMGGTKKFTKYQTNAERVPKYEPSHPTAKKNEYKDKFTQKIEPQLRGKTADEILAIAKEDGIKGLKKTDSIDTLKGKIIQYFVDREMNRDANYTRFDELGEEQQKEIDANKYTAPTNSGAVAEQPTPQKLTEEEYINANGGAAYSNAALHHNRVKSDKIHRQQMNDLANKLQESRTKREQLAQEYQEKLKTGEVVPPTRNEHLIRKANGHEDNESVQAARRLLEKQGIDWRQQPSGEQLQKEKTKKPIPYHNRSLVEDGIKDGASDKVMSLGKTPEQMANARGYTKKSERDAYLQGFEIARNGDYTEEWRSGNHDLSKIAEARGEVSFGDKPMGHKAQLLAAKEQSASSPVLSNNLTKSS